MIRIVVDTNILVSASFWKGNPYKIVQLAAQGKIQIYSSGAVLNEYANALKRDFRLSSEEIEERVRVFLEVLQIITPKTVLNVVKEDPTDNKIIEVALEANARYIVSGDKHLLKLARFEDIQILTPKQFLGKIHAL